MINTRNSLRTVLLVIVYTKGKRSCLSSLFFLPISRQKLIALPQLFTHVFNNNTSFPFRSSVFSIVCGIIVILISIFK